MQQRIHANPAPVQTVAHVAAGVGLPSPACRSREFRLLHTSLFLLRLIRACRR